MMAMCWGAVSGGTGMEQRRELGTDVRIDKARSIQCASDLTCPFRGHTMLTMSKPLTRAEISAALASLTGWCHQKNALTKTFTFTTFPEALSFMVRVGFEAEALNHHPEWSNVYNRVVIALKTHDAGGKVTAKDVTLARRIQEISWVA